MPFEFFLAQTPAQFGQELPNCAKHAWMACHFSPYSSGLSNLPTDLPAGSMVIVNDLIPVASHDPERIATQLHDFVQSHGCNRVLLDFQRPGEARTAAIVRAIVDTLPCPVGIAELYASGFACPVFLPPPPLHLPLQDHLAPWQNRPVWLELMPDCMIYTVTKDGCRKSRCAATGIFPHFDAQARCRYRIEASHDAIRFTLCRQEQELALLQEAAAIECFIGLYQDFAQPEAQSTAFDQ